MQKPVAVPLTITLLLHAAVIVLLAFNLSFSQEPIIQSPQPKIIEAKLVSLVAVPAAHATPKPVEAPPAPVAEAKPVELPEPEPIKPPPPAPKPDLEKEKQVEQKKLLEKEKQIQLEKEKQAQLDKQKAEQQKKEAERKRKEQEQAESLHKKQQEDQLRKQREQQEKNELAKAMAAEDNAMAAERDQEAIASFQGKIAHDIENSWSRPPNARLGMQVTLSIQIASRGRVSECFCCQKQRQ